MKSKIKIYIVLSTALVTLVLFGCTRRDLEMRLGKGYLKINLHWKQSATPEVTTYYFYNSRGDEAIIAEGTSAGYEGWLPEESYHVVISNRKMSGASYQVNGGHEKDIVFAEELVSRAAPGYIGNVEQVYGAGLEDIKVPASDIPVVVDAFPRTYVRYVSFILQSDALENVSALSVEVSGIIYAVKAFTGEWSTTETSTIQSDILKSPENEDFSTTVSVFGFIGTNIITVKATFPGQDSVTTLPLDITEELAALPDEGGTLIIPLQFPDGGKFEIAMKVHPWGWGGNGSGIIE